MSEEQMSAEQQIRLQCLGLAINSIAKGRTEQLVQRAALFEKYVKGSGTRTPKMRTE